MNKKPWLVVFGVSALLLGGCASIPNGPSMMALPGTGRTLDQFRFDDNDCRRYAFQQIGGKTAEQAQKDSAVRSAVIGTAVGAVAGAAIGGRSGAGVGAGTGLVVGSMAGSDSGERSAYGTQRQYDNAYIQCMYAKGHKVPVSASMARTLQQVPSGYAPPATADSRNIPPPPPGNPPPPPPGY